MSIANITQLAALEGGVADVRKASEEKRLRHRRQQPPPGTFETRVFVSDRDGVELANVEPLDHASRALQQRSLLLRDKAMVRKLVRNRERFLINLCGRRKT